MFLFLQALNSVMNFSTRPQGDGDLVLLRGLLHREEHFPLNRTRKCCTGPQLYEDREETGTLRLRFKKKKSHFVVFFFFFWYLWTVVKGALTLKVQLVEFSITM